MRAAGSQQLVSRRRATVEEADGSAGFSQWPVSAGGSWWQPVSADEQAGQFETGILKSEEEKD